MATAPLSDACGADSSEHWTRLRAALDGSKALEAIRDAGAENLFDRAPIERCEVDRVHFGSGLGVVIDYTLHVRQAGSVRRVRAFGQLPERDARSALASAARKLAERNACWPGIEMDHRCLVLVPRLGLILRSIGVDERIDDLTTLVAAASQGVPQARARALARKGCPDGRVELLTHRLGKRAVLRLTTGLGKDEKPRTAILKLYKRGSTAARQAAAITASLLEHEACNAYRSRAPRLHAALEHASALLMEDARGRMLHEIEGPQRLEGQQLAGAALAMLHGSDVDGLEPYTADDELALLRRWAGFMTHAAPSLAGIFARKVAKLDGAQGSCTSNRPIPVHRDFHDKQIIVDAGSATLIDFDTVRRGDPAQDIGNFLAHIRLAALRTAQTREASEHALSAAFLDGYAATLPTHCEKPSAGNIEWYRRASLLRLAFISVFSESARHVVTRLLEDV